MRIAFVDISVCNVYYGICFRIDTTHYNFPCCPAETATPEPISAAYRSLVPNNTATEWLSPYGDSELAVNANDDLAFECIYE